MKNRLIWSLTFSFAIFLNSVAEPSSESDNSVAVAIVYDTSGSMAEPVRDGSGKMSPKYVIANRALTSVINRLAEVANSKTTPRPVLCSLVVFDDNGGAREAVKFGELDPARLTAWVKEFHKPSGSTPLGEAIRTAARPLLPSKAKHKHVLVLTDGINTAGPPPSDVIPKLKTEAERNGSAIFFHFVAFDVAARVFDPVKKLQATVVGAANEKELNTQLDFIVEKKILLEEEEAPAKTNKK
ncbi:MAG: VWA domain-containing protein [Verrucomicrobiota bacterium]|nr:VWA domain-containing protein [Verrucomicrobiota bacterium]